MIVEDGDSKMVRAAIFSATAVQIGKAPRVPPHQQHATAPAFFLPPPSAIFWLSIVLDIEITVLGTIFIS